jgi:ketopantoate reductase
MRSISEGPDQCGVDALINSFAWATFPAKESNPLAETFLAGKSPQLTAPGSTSTSSMYRDLKNQAPVEVDSIVGDLLERGHKQDVSAPLLQTAFVRLTIDQRRRAAVKAAGR